MASIAERFGRRGVQVIGVQSPEFEQEKDLDLVRAAVKRFDITWPIYVDNDEKMWDALGTEAWPSLYVVDRTGGIRLTHIGEIHKGDDDATKIEALLEALLREAAHPPGRPESG